MKRARTFPPRLVGIAALTAALVAVVAGFGGSIGSAQTAAAAPTNTALPTITGTAQVGQNLTAGNGTWTSSASPTFSYQWQRCNATGQSCADIARATSQTYTVQSGDVGSTLRLAVTAKNADGSATATSQQTSTVQASPGTETPGKTVQAATVKLPDRLVVDRVDFTPRVVSSHDPIQARFHVSDVDARSSVQGALVFALGLPYSWARSGGETQTGADGWATVTLSPSFRMPLGRGALVVFVRARVAGDSVLAGASTRRLVQVLIR